MRNLPPDRKHFILVALSSLSVLGMFVASSLWLTRHEKNAQTLSESTLPHVPTTTDALASGTPLSAKHKRSLPLIVSTLILLVIVIATSLAFLQNPLHLSLGPPSTKTGQILSPAMSPTSLPANKNFERGIIYPRWQPGAYGPTDTTWQNGIQTISTQTAARWLEIPILFSQPTSQSTQVGTSQSTASVQSFISGILTAHKQGYKIFFVPLVGVQESGAWSGTVTLPTADKQQAWFDSYWNTLKPYVEAAQAHGVEQMAIGTELQIIQQQVPAPYWNQLISNVRSVFKQNLTYDMNWSSLSSPIPDWFQNADLAMIGVSSYIPLSDTPAQVDPQQIPLLWQQKILSKLDTLSEQIGKKVLISEIGYRNTSDALYHTWSSTSKATTNTTVQADAFDAALSNAYADPHIAGTFFWGWDDVDMFKIKDRPAAEILHKWYSLA